MMKKQRNTLTEDEKTRLRDTSREVFAAKDTAYFDALKSGKSIPEAAELADQAHEAYLQKRWGGARSGAGRKPTGRKDSATLSFNISEEFKSKFEREAQKAGMTKTEFFKKLLSSYSP